jgi:hypothetical protein
MNRPGVDPTPTPPQGGFPSQPFASIVIPVFHDAAVLAATLATLPIDPDVEVIVVDGAPPSAAMTRLAREWPRVRWDASAPGRGRQMNHGATLARGRWLIFLHADCRLPESWRAELEGLDARHDVVGGSFAFRLDSAALAARVIEWGVRRRVAWFGLPYGDQALFARHQTFRRIGGYADWLLMEDVEFIRRLARVGRLHHSSHAVLVSARRWERDGWLRRTAMNVVLVGLYALGASPLRLARLYYGRQIRRVDD